jgi:GT2 family glycosyltransferase
MGLCRHPFGPISFFGPVPAACELLDGVFIAAKKEALREKQVAFDTRFDFHFYDLDFCRTARQSGLRLGTWPICLTHQSAGTATPEWLQAYQVYVEKWGESGTVQGQPAITGVTEAANLRSAAPGLD